MKKSLLGSIFVMMLLLQFDAAGQESEIHIKAAFLYKFCGYTAWPNTSFSAADAPFVIGVAGDDDEVREITHVLTGKSLGQRGFAVNRIKAGDDLQGIHILYINAQSPLRARDFITRARNAPILTITEEISLPEFGIVNFVRRQNFVRFEISQTRAEEVGLELSSQLLAVAVKVY